MKEETLASKQETTDVFQGIGKVLEESVEESRSVEKIHQLTGDILDIAVTIEESAKAVTSVATDASDLVSVIVDIQNETNNNKRVSEDMESQVSMFKKL